MMSLLKRRRKKEKNKDNAARQKPRRRSEINGGRNCWDPCGANEMEYLEKKV